jgi:predicted TIM-barrel fold metal-dependent hydrolase
MNNDLSHIRRKILKGFGSTAALSILNEYSSVNARPAYTRPILTSVPFSTGNESPNFPIPTQACDCHHHIFNDKYPVDRTATPLQPNASVTDYRKLQRRLGLQRNIIIQPSVYGTDNSLLVRSLKEMGINSRGICVVDANATDKELERLHAVGVRGIRFNLKFLVGITAEMMLPLSQRIAPLGWNIQVNGTGEKNLEYINIFKNMPSKIVFDHLGQLPQPAGIDHPSFKMYADLLSSGNTWMKLSGAYITSKKSDYSDTTIVAKKFIEIAPDRVIWGTDWPHTSKKANEKPDDARIMDQIAIWTPSAAIREKILVANPADLYGFN